MGKIVCFLLAFMACMPAMLWADDDDSKYLAGAVPEEDGKVVFTKEFNMPGADKNSIFDQVHNWLEARMKENKNESRIVFVDKEKGQIVASVEEYLLFTSSVFSLDRSIFNYNLVVSCKPGKCEMQIERIRFTYEKNKSSAEEMITDKVALNKKKTEIYRGYKKFRIGVIDYVDNFFGSANTAFSAKEVGVKQESTATHSSQTTKVEPVERADNVPVVAPINQQAGTSDALQGYKQLTPDKIPGNIMKMLHEDWMLITAGTDEKFNMMTASMGGLGMYNGKQVAFCFIKPSRYTYQLMETNDTYTLTFYTEAYREALRYCGSNSGRDADKVKNSGLTPITTPLGSKAFSEAWMIIECRKYVGQPLSVDALYDEKMKANSTDDQLHKLYIGEIVNVWVK